MSRRIEQPPIDPSRRDPEARGFWPGFVLAVAGLILLSSGLLRSTEAETADGERVRETQLVKAFTSSGIHLAESATQAPPRLEPPPEPGQPFEPRFPPPPKKAAKHKWVVDVKSQAACPT
jgi:hypothetical protein